MKQDAKCFECGAPAEVEHHVVPQVLGGTKTVPLCSKCHGIVHECSMGSSALIKAGIARARAAGKSIGRPRKYDWAVVLKLRAEGMSSYKIAAILGINPSSVRWIIAEAGSATFL